jgi:hypothetical protein
VKGKLAVSKHIVSRDDIKHAEDQNMDRMMTVTAFCDVCGFVKSVEVSYLSEAYRELKQDGWELHGSTLFNTFGNEYNIDGICDKCRRGVW